MMFVVLQYNWQIFVLAINGFTIEFVGHENWLLICLWLIAQMFMMNIL